MFPTSPRPNRRSFLTALGALSGIALISGSARARVVSTDKALAPWDLSWLDSLNGKHRQLFDFGKADLTEGNHLVVVRNYLNAHRDVFALEFPQVNTVVGIAYEAYPINASDRLWAKYPIGEKWKIKDSQTGEWARRNVFAAADQTGPTGGFSVPAVVARGTVFWQCNNAFGRVVSELAKASGNSADVVRADLLDGMMPGVHLVPAHTMLVGLAQEKGFTYESL